MKNVVRILLFPVAIYFAIYLACYEIFWWAMVVEKSPWTRGGQSPIKDAMEFARDLMTFRSS